MVVYYLVKILDAIAGRLPLRMISLWGRVGGIILYSISKKRVIGFRNLKLVFPDKSSREIFRIFRKSCLNFGISVMETFVSRRIIDAGRVKFGQSTDIRDPSILVGIHEGSWEVLNVAFGEKYGLAILAQKQRVLGFDRFLNEKRQQNGIKVFFSLKSLLDFVKRNKEYHIGIVIDQGHEKNAPLVEFFGCEVPTPRGAVYLARKLGRRIYPFFSYRRGENLHLISSVPISCEGKKDMAVLRELHQVYEDFLRRYPEEYIWWYKKFKRKKKLHILILSDGKAGHLKQSLALLHFFKELDYKIEEEIVEIKVSNRLVRFLLEVTAFFSLRSDVGSAGILPFVLSKHAYSRITRSFYDIVISTGSSVAPINLFVAHFLGARSVTIMKPNLPISRFDLAIVPEHDRISADNAVTIKGALSYPYNLERNKTEFSRKFKLGEHKKVSLFVGGPLEDDDVFIKNLRTFIPSLKDFVTKHNYSLLVTTSRRTPLPAEQLIQKEFSSFPATEVMIVASKQNYPFVVDGFLYYSRVVFVTTDSISMISESLGMQKTTVGVELERLLDTHHINFFMSVKELVNFLEAPYKFYNFHAPSYSLLSYNRGIVKEAIKRVL